MERLLAAAVIVGPPLGCTLVLLLIFHLIHRTHRKAKPALPYPDASLGAGASAAAAAMNLQHDLALNAELPLRSAAGRDDEEIYKTYLMAYVPMSERRLGKLPLVLLAARRLGQDGGGERKVRRIDDVVSEARSLSRTLKK